MCVFLAVLSLAHSSVFTSTASVSYLILKLIGEPGYFALVLLNSKLKGKFNGGWSKHHPWEGPDETSFPWQSSWRSMSVCPCGGTLTSGVIPTTVARGDEQICLQLILLEPRIDGRSHEHEEHTRISGDERLYLGLFIPLALLGSTQTHRAQDIL